MCEILCIWKNYVHWEIGYIMGFLLMRFVYWYLVMWEACWNLAAVTIILLKFATLLIIYKKQKMAKISHFIKSLSDKTYDNVNYRK